MLLFYLQETIRIFKRSPFASSATIIVSTIAITLFGISLILLFASNRFFDKIKNNIEINLYLENGIDSAKVSAINDMLKGNDYIKAVKYIGKEEAANLLMREVGEDFRVVLENNPLPNSFSVKLKGEVNNVHKFERVVNELKKIEGVSEVMYDYNLVLKIFNYIESGGRIIYAVTILSVIFAIYLLFTLNRLSVMNNLLQYDTMKIVGAKLSAIKIPLILSGLGVGIISSLISLLFINIMLGLLTAFVIKVKFSHLIFILGFIQLGFGILLGLGGSLIATTKIKFRN